MLDNKQKKEILEEHKKRVRAAKNAIKTVFQDKSVSEEQTVRSLEELKDEAETCIQAMF